LSDPDVASVAAGPKGLTPASHHRPIGEDPASGRKEAGGTGKGIHRRPEHPVGEDSEGPDDGGREDLDWSPEALRRALEGVWRAAAQLLEEAMKERP